jgi:hypothetical protein
MHGARALDESTGCEWVSKVFGKSDVKFKGGGAQDLVLHQR